MSGEAGGIQEEQGGKFEGLSPSSYHTLDI
jgi:hypothetical protein